MSVSFLSRATAIALLLGCSGCGVDRESSSGSIEAYTFLVGTWEGELEYLDYGDNRTLVRLPTNLSCEANSDGSSLELRFSYVEPSGRIETSTELLRVADEGLYMGDLWQIQEAQLDSPDAVLLILERDGEDNGQAAAVVNTITLQGDDLTITSTVTYEASGESLQRHQYRFRRVSTGPEGE